MEIYCTITLAKWLNEGVNSVVKYLLILIICAICIELLMSQLLLLLTVDNKLNICNLVEWSSAFTGFVIL